MRVDVTQTIKDRLTMPDVLQHYGYDVKRRMPCPIHKGKDENCEVKKNSFMCYSHCGGGDVITFVQKLFDLPFSDAVKKIDVDFGLGIYDKKISKRRQIEIEREIFAKKKKQEEELKLIAEKENSVDVLIDKFLKYDKNRKQYKPKSQNDILHPLFVEAISNLEHIKYEIEIAEAELYLLKKSLGVL